MSTVGDRMRLSGYAPVMLTDTSVIWFCPGCVEALRPHIKAIVEATGGRSLYWDNMIAMALLKRELTGAKVFVGKKET
jgi:hypothetical protein